MYYLNKILSNNMIKVNTKTFFIFHAFSIVIFFMIYYYLMEDINKHFMLVNPNMNKDIFLNSLYYSAGVQSTNGASDILPTSLIARSVTLTQYFATLFITIGCFTFL